MLFCTRCRALIYTIQTTPSGKVASCSCGNFFEIKDEISLKEKNNTGKEIIIVDDKNLLAVHKHICKKCGYDRAQLIEIGAMYGDEEDIVRYKCGKCGYVEQLAAKI